MVAVYRISDTSLGGNASWILTTRRVERVREISRVPLRGDAILMVRKNVSDVLEFCHLDFIINTQ